MIAFIREHKDHRVDGGLRWGVQPICAVLSEHGCQIAPSTYYERLARVPGRRDQRDNAVAALIAAQREQHRFARSLGSRKTWLRLRGQGHDVARCTVERVMRGPGGEPPYTARRRWPPAGWPEVAGLRAKAAGLGAELAGHTPASS